MLHHARVGVQRGERREVGVAPEAQEEAIGAELERVDGVSVSRRSWDAES
jgi:hypothetical protein